MTAGHGGQPGDGNAGPGGPREAAVWERILDHARSGGVEVSLAAACAACVEELRIDGLGVSLITAGQLRTIACATDERAARLEDAQLVTGEGPCTEAYVQRALVEEQDLRREPVRWPAFTERAAELDVRAVFALPVNVGRLRVGVMDLYRTRPGPLEPAHWLRARAYARVIGLLILDEHADMLTTDIPDPRPGPQGYPPEVHQAAGVLAARHDLSTDDALSRLRAHAYGSDLPLLETARRVLEGTFSFAQEREEEPGRGQDEA